MDRIPKLSRASGSSATSAPAADTAGADRSDSGSPGRAAFALQMAACVARSHSRRRARTYRRRLVERAWRTDARLFPGGGQKRPALLVIPCRTLSGPNPRRLDADMVHARNICVTASRECHALY